MKTPQHAALRVRFDRLVARLPEPAQALRLARLLIPLCLVVGLLAAPVARWLLPI
ncbi:MAG: hypothetical protein H7067_20340 [Burkholderiales bacterium]|nr:hypothetical protein [Opitutaceae bacterium]